MSSSSKLFDTTARAKQRQSDQVRQIGLIPRHDPEDHDVDFRSAPYPTAVFAGWQIDPPANTEDGISASCISKSWIACQAIVQSQAKRRDIRTITARLAELTEIVAGVRQYGILRSTSELLRDYLELIQLDNH